MDKAALLRLSFFLISGKTLAPSPTYSYIRSTSPCSTSSGCSTNHSAEPELLLPELLVALLCLQVRRNGGPHAHYRYFLRGGCIFLSIFKLWFSKEGAAKEFALRDSFLSPGICFGCVDSRLGSTRGVSVELRRLREESVRHCFRQRVVFA